MGAAEGEEEERDIREKEKESGDNRGEGEGGRETRGMAAISVHTLRFPGTVSFSLPPSLSSPLPGHRGNSEKRQIGMTYLRTTS